jgi:hypothetical protein
MNAPQTGYLDGLIRDGRHHMQVRVYYEDTDFSDRSLRLSGPFREKVASRKARRCSGTAYIRRASACGPDAPNTVDQVAESDAGFDRFRVSLERAVTSFLTSEQ